MTRFDLRLQDCVTGMASVPDQHLDLVVTSPPYNLGIRYRKFSDRQDRRLYLNWCAEWAAQIRRILKPSGSLFLNIGAAPSNPMLPHEIVMTLRNFFVLQNTIHWIKSIAVDTAQGRTSAPNLHLNPLGTPPGRDPSLDAKRQVTVNGGGATRVDRMIGVLLGIGNCAVTTQSYGVTKIVRVGIAENYLAEA